MLNPLRFGSFLIVAGTVWLSRPRRAGLKAGFAAFFSHAALAALAAIRFVMAIVCVVRRREPEPGGKGGPGQPLGAGGLRLTGLLLGWLPAWTDRQDIWCMDGDSVRWVGVVLFAIGGALRLWPVFVLGNRFSGLVAIQQGHTLVTTGIYSKVRNPSYLGLAALHPWLEPRISVLGGRHPDGPDDPAAVGAHGIGGTIAAGPSSARSMTPTAPAPRGWCRGSIRPDWIKATRPGFASRCLIA